MANQTNGNQFRDDEIIILEQLRDGKMVKNIFSKIGGRVRLAHEDNDQLSITTEIIKYYKNLAEVKTIRNKDIALYDMIGPLRQGVDIHPEDQITPPCEKGIRSNRFQSFMGCDRMEELLCVGKYSEWNSYPPLKIQFQDLFRFWWNRCVQQEEVADEILEDIFTYFTALMQPPKEEEPQMDLTLDFNQLPLFVDKAEEAA